MSAAMWARRALVGLAAIVGMAVATGAVYEHIGRGRATDAFPMRGKLVDVGGGRRLQLDCRGSGSPTVVLESGLDDKGSLAWAAVHDSIALTTRACAYSRPGIMWSDPANGAFDVRALEKDLHTALIASGESAPWIMVGHSIGGPYAMTFASIYDSEVAGMVMVDPTHPDQFARFREVVGKPMEPSPAIFKLGASLAWTGLVRLLPADPSPATWPRESVDAAQAFLPVSLGELAKEVEAVPATLATSGQFRTLRDRPFVVLTAMIGQSDAELKMNGITRAQGEAIHAATRVLHADMATWSSRGRQELVEGASHYIHFDRPNTVIAAVREVVAQTR